MPTEVQSILIKKRYYTPEKAKEWVKKHEYKVSKMTEEGKHHRFRQKNPDQYDRFVSKKITPSITFVLGIKQKGGANNPPPVPKTPVPKLPAHLVPPPLPKNPPPPMRLPRRGRRATDAGNGLSASLLSGGSGRRVGRPRRQPKRVVPKVAPKVAPKAVPKPPAWVSMSGGMNNPPKAPNAPRPKRQAPKIPVGAPLPARLVLPLPPPKRGSTTK